MHDRGVVHRDLKYENILFENPSPSAEVKVIDFGLSKKFTSGTPGIMTERVGTMYVEEETLVYVSSGPSILTDHWFTFT